MSSQRVLPSPPPLKPEQGLPDRKSTRTRPAPSTARAAASPAERRHRLGNLIVTIVLSLGAVVMVAPLLWTFSTSLKTRDGVFALPPQWIPDPFVWENYLRIWSAGPLLTGISLPPLRRVANCCTARPRSPPLTAIPWTPSRKWPSSPRMPWVFRQPFSSSTTSLKA